MKIDWKSDPRLIGVRNSLKQQALILGGLIAVLWIVELTDILLLDNRLNALGVRPRTVRGLRYILISPFMHAGVGHLFANTIPLLILGWLVLLRGLRNFINVSLIAAVISGLGIWIFGGTNTIHVGISGVIFGYLGYLLARGYFERSVPAIGLAFIALIMYGGMLWGFVPGREGVSWLGHVFGFVGGGVAGYLLSATRQRQLPLINMINSRR